VKEFRETLAPVIVDLVQQHLDPVDTSNLDMLLKKDAGKNTLQAFVLKLGLIYTYTCM